YNDHLGAERVAAEVTGPTFDTSREGRGVPYLDVVASRSSDGRHVYVKAVNTSPRQAMRTPITVSGAPITPRGPIETLAAASLSAQAPRWTESKAQAWDAQQPWLIGSNYVPRSAINQLEMWQEASFDPEQIDRELGWAEAMGMNTMRVFLHDLPWQQDAVGFRK